MTMSVALMTALLEMAIGMALAILGREARGYVLNGVVRLDGLPGL